LEEFYLERSANTAYDVTGVGKGMLRLIDMIKKLFKETLIWGLTSHARLLLLNTDGSASPWYVAMVGSSLEITGIPDYQFEYLVPADKQPWANAQMKGEAANLAEAERYLLIAMYESQGWEGNKELNRLMVERGLV
jgi:hypothetical protein